MSDDAPHPDAAQNPTGDPAQQPKPDTSTDADRDVEGELAKWKSQARKHQKDYEAAAKRLTELEDRDKTEAQKQADAMARLKTENAELHRALLRMKVTSELGLPADLAELLQGDDEPAMVATGKKLLALRDNGNGLPTPKRPSARSAGLGSTGRTDKPMDANDVLRLMSRG